MFGRGSVVVTAYEIQKRLSVPIATLSLETEFGWECFLIGITCFLQTKKQPGWKVKVSFVDLYSIIRKKEKILDKIIKKMLTLLYRFDELCITVKCNHKSKALTKYAEMNLLPHQM